MSAAASKTLEEELKNADVGVYKHVNFLHRGDWKEDWFFFPCGEGTGLVKSLGLPEWGTTCAIEVSGDLGWECKATLFIKEGHTREALVEAIRNTQHTYVPNQTSL